MITTRKQRIAVEVLGPPLLGWVLIYGFFFTSALWNAIEQGHVFAWQSPTLSEIGVGLAVAYWVAGIPSVFYTLVMEWRFARGLNPRSWNSVCLSSLLGLLSGCALLFVASGREWKLEATVACGIAGSAVGFMLGVVIKKTSALVRDA